MSQLCRVSSSHKNNLRICQSSTMNQRHRAEYSLNLSSRPLPCDPSLNPHLDSLSTLDWLQPFNHSPHPCAAPVVQSRRLSTNIMFTHPRQELLQHLHKTLWLRCDSFFPESPGLQHPFKALIQLQIPPGHLHRCLRCSPNHTNQVMHQCTIRQSDLHQQSSEPTRIGTTAPQRTHHWDNCLTTLAHLESRLLSSGANIMTPLLSYRVILSQPWCRRIYINLQLPHLMFCTTTCGAPSGPSTKQFRGRTIRPTACGAPATTTISDWWSPTCTFCAPTGWATRRTAPPSTNATRPSIPNLGCTLPRLYCAASCTSACTE